MRRSLRSSLLTSLVVSVVVTSAVACGSDADTAATETSAVVSTAPVDGSTSTTTPSGTTTTHAATDALPGASLDPKSGQAAGDTVALLGAVRAARNDGFDRVVFEFTTEAVPAWDVAYVDGPFTSDGEGAPVAVDGSAFLRVIMRGASGFDIDTGEQVYDGGDRVVPAGTTRVTEVVRLGDFEGQLEWIIGLDSAMPFRVVALPGPNRLVVDIAHSAS